MLHLAMKVWNLDVDQALFRLSAEIPEIHNYNFQPHNLLEYKREYDRHERATAFWQKCQEALPRSVEMRQLRMHLDMATSLGKEIWQRRGGQYIGSAVKEDINAATGLARNLFSGCKYDGCRNSRFFATEECVVLPFADLPGRLSAFLIHRLNQEGTGAVPVAYYTPLLPLGTLPQQRKLAPGVLMLDTLLNRSIDSDPVLIFLDPMLAVRIQIQHLRHKAEPLPIGAIWPAAPVSDILSSHVRDIVLWTEKLDLDVFRHAKALNARISVSTAVMQEVYGQLKRQPIPEWIRTRVRWSKPWEAALENHLLNISVPEAESILIRLGMDSEELERFLTGCSKKLQNRMGQFMKSSHRKVLAVGRGKFYETDDGWFNNKNGMQISDAIIRIERTIYRPRLKTIAYEGYVLFHGNKIPFKASSDDLNNRATKSWLQRFLVANGYPLPRVYAAVDAGLFDIAVAFHPPQTIHGIEGYGWDETNSQFCFPNFAIRYDGSVSNRPPLAFYNYDAPMGDLLPPEDLDFASIEVLNESPWTWAVAACVLHNLIAKYFRWQQVGIGITGEISQTCRAIARAMGCPVYIYNGRRPELAAYLKRRELAGDWPLFIDGIEFASAPLLEWLRNSEHNCMASTNWYAAHVCATYGGWFTIEDAVANIKDGQLLASSKIIPAFLKWLMLQKLPRKCQKNSLDFTVDLMTEWFESIGGDQETVLDGSRLVNNSGPIEAFKEILCSLYDDGHLTLRPENYSGKEVAALVYNDLGHLWISKTGINQAMGKAWMPALNTVKLTTVLTESGELLFEKEFQDRPGWVIWMKSWENWLRRWRSKKRKYLKLIG